jgi:hypothetical protein
MMCILWILALLWHTKMIIVVCFFFSFTVSVSGFGGRFGEN